MIRKCDLSSLLKASLKLPGTYRKTDDRVIRDGAYNLLSIELPVADLNDQMSFTNGVNIWGRWRGGMGGKGKAVGMGER